jgi:hypothetical protein
VAMYNNNKRGLWLHRQREHVLLLADPPGSQVSGALKFSWNAIQNLSEENTAHDVVG